MGRQPNDDLAAELARNARVIQVMNQIYRKVRAVMISESEELIGKVYRDKEEVSLNEIYARIKLLVAYRMMSECHEWTVENYEVKDK